MISGHPNLMTQKKDVTYDKCSTLRWFVWNTNIAAVSLFWNTDMADATSCENALYSSLHLQLTLYTGIQIKSMKPTCIFGKSSFFLRSIIGWKSVDYYKILGNCPPTCPSLSATFRPKYDINSCNVRFNLGTGRWAVFQNLTRGSYIQEKDQSPVVRGAINANLRFNFIPGFIFFYSKAFSLFFLRLSNHLIIDKKN